MLYSLTQVVVFVLWSMKKGLPFGALRTSQPAGMKPHSKELSGELRGEPSGAIGGCPAEELWVKAFCAAASDVIWQMLKIFFTKQEELIFRAEPNTGSNCYFGSKQNDNKTKIFKYSIWCFFLFINQ